MLVLMSWSRRFAVVIAGLRRRDAATLYQVVFQLILRATQSTLPQQKPCFDSSKITAVRVAQSRQAR